MNTMLNFKLGIIKFCKIENVKWRNFGAVTQNVRVLKLDKVFVF